HVVDEAVDDVRAKGQRRFFLRHLMTCPSARPETMTNGVSTVRSVTMFGANRNSLPRRMYAPTGTATPPPPPALPSSSPEAPPKPYQVAATGSTFTPSRSCCSPYEAVTPRLPLSLPSSIAMLG